MNVTLNVVLPKFEGPLDLLLHLLEKNEVDIYDIPINKITNQFIEYINRHTDNQLELTSEFVVMAAHLLEIKSRMLLPIHDPDDDSYEQVEDDPRYQLVQRLIEYRTFKEASQKLAEFNRRNGGIAFRDQTELARFSKGAKTIDLSDIDVSLLSEALNAVIMRIPQFDETRADYFKTLRRDSYTVEDKLLELQLRFEEKFRWTFNELIVDVKDRLELIVIFLALLELLKIEDISIYQASSFAEIVIEKN